MEILILIGIFAFVVAIIFRSNEALDRVQEVEKEVKVIEEEMSHKDQVLTDRGVPMDSEAEQSSAAPVAENSPATATAPIETVMEESVSREAVAAPTEPIQTNAQLPASDAPFPSAENVHTS